MKLFPAQQDREGWKGFMGIDEKKRSFWGYKRDGVYHIVSLEDKVSERMAEQEARLEKVKAEAERQIAALEKKVAELQEENDALHRNVSAMYMAMQEAQEYADQLHAGTREVIEEFESKMEDTERTLTRLSQRTRTIGAEPGAPAADSASDEDGQDAASSPDMAAQTEAGSAAS